MNLRTICIARTLIQLLLEDLSLSNRSGVTKPQVFRTGCMMILQTDVPKDGFGLWSPGGVTIAPPRPLDRSDRRRSSLFQGGPRMGGRGAGIADGANGVLGIRSGVTFLGKEKLASECDCVRDPSVSGAPWARSRKAIYRYGALMRKKPPTNTTKI